MNILTENYVLKTNKVKKNIKILLISDIHYMDGLATEYNKTIIYKSKEIAPNYIVLGGDYFCGNGQFNLLKESSLECLKELIDGLKKVCPVIMILGNHDLSIKQDKEMREKFRSLKEKNVYPLDNDTIEFKDIRFDGFFANRKSYAISKISDKKRNIIIDDWNKLNFVINKEKYNILCHHIPDTIFDKNIQKKAPTMYNYDLVLSGHTHNGWLSPNQEIRLSEKINDKMLNTTDKKKKQELEIKKYRGFCESIKNNPPFVRTYCRGIHEVNGTKLIISKGITSGLKWALGNKLIFDTRKEYSYVTVIDICKE